MNKAELRALAEAAAKSAPIQKIAEGVGLNLTDREWKAQCDDRSLYSPITERYVVTDHLGRERVRNGLGEWVA